MPMIGALNEASVSGVWGRKVSLFPGSCHWLQLRGVGPTPLQVLSMNSRGPSLAKASFPLNAQSLPSSRYFLMRDSVWDGHLLLSMEKVVQPRAGTYTDQIATTVLRRG